MSSLYIGGRSQATYLTWYLMCYHARTKKRGKGYLFQVRPRLGVFLNVLYVIL